MEGEATGALVQVRDENLTDISKREMPATRVPRKNSLKKEVAGSSGLVQALVENLIDNPKKNSEKLTVTLKAAQKLLNKAETLTIPSEDGFKNWFKRLEAVVFDADNVLDELDYHLLSKNISIPTRAKLLKSSNHYGRQRRLATRIMEINEEFESISNEATKFGLVSEPADGPDLLCAIPETGSFSADPIFVGRDADVPKLADLLINTTTEERLLPILVIQGVGGMGKTALARKLFNHPKIQMRFGESRIWVRVSQTCDSVLIFKKILKDLTSDQVESRGDILKRLQQVLKCKTYLLVLDDVWIEDVPKWEDFIKLLAEVTSTKGNAIIITTRNQECAPIVGPLHIHPLIGLSDEECWSIIKSKAFDDKGEYPSAFETIRLDIARKCYGLPLAAEIVGGLLCKASEQKWNLVHENLLLEDEGHNISKILKLSLQNLSFSLNKCFAYCSIFPQGRTIVKEELIELWMAEGFLQTDQENDMEYAGDKFFDVLLHKCLLQAAERDEYGNVSSCVMHDLIYVHASSVLGSSDNADSMDPPARYMIHEEESSPIPKQVGKHLRTIFLEGEISDIMFSDLESLRNLTLSRVKELPNSIGKLIHLRNLNISKSWITELPEWIGELHHLQTIRAVTEHLWKLPSTLKYLINLRHLYILSRVKLPAEIGRLTSLQTLRHFAVGAEKGYQIEELGSLNNLKGELHISNLEKVHDKADAEKANIHLKPNLSELVLEWSADREGESTDESVLEGLQPHADANLKKLEIKGYKGKSFPLWTEKMTEPDGPQGSWVPLTNLVEIKLSWCSECEEIPTLEDLPNIKSLYLEGMKKVRFIKSSFKNLRTLYISELEGLESLPEWLFNNNQNLSHLTIIQCPNLRELPHGLDTLNSLEELSIENCASLESIGNNPSGTGGHESQGILCELSTEGCREVMELRGKMAESWVQSLQTLSLKELGKLKNLPEVIDCLSKSTRLRELEIRGVPKFMATCGVVTWPFGNLQELNIDVSVVWSRHNSDVIKHTVDGILQGCSNSLTRLWLRGVQNWKYMPRSIQHLAALSKLEIQNFGIEELPQWFVNLSSLSQLSLSSCKKLRCLFSVNALKRLTELRRLDIIDCPRLKIDPEWVSISHLTIKVDDNFNGSCSEEITDGGVSSAAIEVLFQNLINAFKEAYALRRGLNKDAQQLHGTLVIIQGYLNDAKKKSITQDTVKFWLEELEGLAFNADNVFDEHNYYHLLRSKVEKMKTPMNKVLSCFSTLNHMVRKPNMAQRIKHIKTEFDTMKEWATVLGLKKSRVNTAAPPASSQTNYLFTLDGMDNDVRELVEKLTHVPEAAKLFSILAIVGMDGIGKATLTRKVLHHQSIKARFGLHVWVHVSQNFDPIMLFKNILSTLACQTIDKVETMGSILKKLQQVLKGKTYLLVLDDVRNEGLSNWKDFIKFISEVTSTKGNAIIITTRNQKVASTVGSGHIHQLRGLSYEECWSIIKGKTFGKTGKVPPELETIGRMIATGCQGSRLAANVVGGVLCSNSKEKYWRFIYEKWLSDGEGDENISKILKLSYDQLPSPSLKKCFAYCSIFPKGHRIVKEELIGLWMAEGFLQANESDAMESAYESDGMESANDSMQSENESDGMESAMESENESDAMESANESDGTESEYESDAMESANESDGMESAIESANESDGMESTNENDGMESVGDKIFNVLLQKSLLQIAERDNHGNVLSCVMDDLAHDLASFVLGSVEGSNQNRYLIQGSPIAEVTAKKYLRTLIFQGEITNPNMFSGFESLHALTLDSDEVKELPTSVRKLILLRNLNISRTRIEKLPSWISELHYLQTLNASTESLRKLPSTLKYLISLRHLYLCHDVELPAEIGRLTSLQTLRHFTVGDKKGCRIEELESLMNLKGKLVIHNLERVRGEVDALKANLSQKPHLSGLWFEWDEGREGEGKDESVLKGLQPHANLKNLCLKGFKGKKFPSWTQNMEIQDSIGLDKLIEITLDSCKECKEIPKLGQLPNLKSLNLLRLSKVKSINSSFYGMANAAGGDIFPALESVLLRDMDELGVWAQVEIANEEKVFPSLQSLKIYLCNKLEDLPSLLFRQAHNLKELDIRHCSMLRELPDGLHTLKSLESIAIKGCPNLESIPSPDREQRLNSLRSLEIRDCQRLKTMIESWAMPSLKRVCMSELKSLENLPKFLDCLSKSPLLAELTIVGIPILISTSGVEIWPLRKLRKLEIAVTTEWSSEINHEAIKKVVNVMLLNCSSSLGELKLTGAEMWKNVPESIGNLTALYSLELENFGVEKLPEWIGNLRSLTRLCLYNFTKLECLPSMQNPTTLQELHIRNCPKLRIEYEGHKVFHGCAIYFNGHQI